MKREKNTIESNFHQASHKTIAFNCTLYSFKIVCILENIEDSYDKTKDKSLTRKSKGPTESRGRLKGIIWRAKLSNEGRE